MESMIENHKKITVGENEVLKLENLYGFDESANDYEVMVLEDLEIDLLSGASLVLNLANWNIFGQQKIQINHLGKESRSEVKYAMSFWQDSKFELDLQVRVQADKVESEVLIKSVQADSSRTRIEGNIQAISKVRELKGDLQEAVVLLGNKAWTNLTPILEVASKEVDLKHGVKVSNLSEDSLFYLMSRGMLREEARALLFDGFLKEVYSGFEKSDLIETYGRLGRD